MPSDATARSQAARKDTVNAFRPAWPAETTANARIAKILTLTVPRESQRK